MCEHYRPHIKDHFTQVEAPRTAKQVKLNTSATTAKKRMNDSKHNTET